MKMDKRMVISIVAIMMGTVDTKGEYNFGELTDDYESYYENGQ